MRWMSITMQHNNNNPMLSVARNYLMFPFGVWDAWRMPANSMMPFMKVWSFVCYVMELLLMLLLMLQQRIFENTRRDRNAWISERTSEQIFVCTGTMQFNPQHFVFCWSVHALYALAQGDFLEVIGVFKPKFPCSKRFHSFTDTSPYFPEKLLTCENIINEMEKPIRKMNDYGITLILTELAGIRIMAWNVQLRYDPDVWVHPV